MKTVKIILGIIVVLSLLFFGTGIVIKDINYTSEVAIDASIEKTFELFDNNDNLSKWIPEIKAIKTIKKEEEVIGSTFEVKVENQGKEVVFEEKVLKYEPYKNVKFLFKGGNVHKIDDYTFSLKEGKTHVRLTSKFQTDSFILGCMLPFVKGKLSRQDQQYLENFKNFVEKK